MFVILTAWKPTDRARYFALDVSDAVAATMGRKVFAVAMGLVLKDGTPNEAEASAQLNCQKPLNLFRLAAIEDEDFWDALQERIAKRRGGMYLRSGLLLALQGAAEIGKRRMARMAIRAERRKVS